MKTFTTEEVLARISEIHANQEGKDLADHCNREFGLDLTYEGDGLFSSPTMESEIGRDYDAAEQAFRKKILDRLVEIGFLPSTHPVEVQSAAPYLDPFFNYALYDGDPSDRSRIAYRVSHMMLALSSMLDTTLDTEI